LSDASSGESLVGDEDGSVLGSSAAPVVAGLFVFALDW
jgi:hypothetical protein